MKTYKQFLSEYDQDHPVVPKPSRVWLRGPSGDDPGKRTKKGQEWHDAYTKHQKNRLSYASEKVTEQATTSGQRVFTDVEREAWIDGLDYGFDEEYHFVRLIRQTLLTPKQVGWLNQKGYSIEDCLNGRTPCDEEAETIQVLYKPWNDILKANGLSASFMEDEICEAMLDSISNTVQSIDPNIQRIEFR